MRTPILVGFWLAAITAANLITSHYGPEASIYTSFFLVAITLVVRDLLHDRWEEHRILKMVALILAGAALAYLASPDAARIGLASCAAFAIAETVDGIVYHAVRFLPWVERSNASNFVGAMADSIVFPWVAFGSLMWALTFAQFTAKVAGALLFSLLIVRAREARA